MKRANPEALELAVVFSYNPASGLFSAKLDNGAVFSVSPNNVSGKLGENLDLLRNFTMREKNGEPPSPHVTVAKIDRDAQLIVEALAAGKLQKVGVIPDIPLLDF